MSKTIIYSAVFIIIIVAGAYWFLNSQEIKAPNDISINMKQENAASPAHAILKTSKGEIELELYPSVAPKTVENFLKLAREKFYDGTKFHRVIPDFMIQGGDPLSRTDDPMAGTGGPGYKFADEINPRSIGVPENIIKQHEAEGYDYDFSLTSVPVDAGTIAMANSGPNTNGSQFFIVTYRSQPHLNGKHTVFGKVIRGMDVVRAIRQGDVLNNVVIN